MASLKKAIIAKCKQCTYDDAQPGTYLMQIEQCTVKACPLWEVRPCSNATLIAARKARAGQEIDINSILDSLEDEESEEA